MTDAEQLARIRDTLRPVLGTESCPECAGIGKIIYTGCGQVPCLACGGKYVDQGDGILRGTGTRDVMDGISVEDAVRRVIEMVQHMPTNQDLLDAAVDAQSRTDKYAKMMLELEAERDAARAAVAEMRERAAKEADLRGGMTKGGDYDRHGR